MKKLTMVMAVLFVASSVASATFTWAIPHDELGYGAHIRVAAAPRQIQYEGQTVWEYAYDLGTSPWGSGDGWRVPDYWYGAFLEFGPDGEAGDLVGLRDGKLAETWTSWAAGYDAGSASQTHAQWVNGTIVDGVTTIVDEWLYGVDSAFAVDRDLTFDPALATWAFNNGTDNIWHAPSEYEPLDGTLSQDLGTPGNIMDDATSVPMPWGAYSYPGGVDGIQFGHVGLFHGNVAQEDSAMLIMTIRVLSTQGPYGTVTLQYDSGYGAHKYGETVVGPGIPEPATMSLLGLGGLVALIRRKK